MNNSNRKPTLKNPMVSTGYGANVRNGSFYTGNDTKKEKVKAKMGSSTRVNIETAKSSAAKGSVKHPNTTFTYESNGKWSGATLRSE